MQILFARKVFKKVTSEHNVGDVRRNHPWMRNVLVADRYVRSGFEPDYRIEVDGVLAGRLHIVDEFTITGTHVNDCVGSLNPPLKIMPRECEPDPSPFSLVRDKAICIDEI